MSNSLKKSLPASAMMRIALFTKTFSSQSWVVIILFADFKINASKSFLVDNSRFIRNHGSIYSLTTGVLNNTLITEDYGPSVGFSTVLLIPIIRNMQSIVNSNFTKNKDVIISTSFVHYGDNIYLYNFYI